MIPWESSWGEHSWRRKEPMVWLRDAEYGLGGEETEFASLAPPSREGSFAFRSYCPSTWKSISLHPLLPFFPPYPSHILILFSSSSFLYLFLFSPHLLLLSHFLPLYPSLPPISSLRPFLPQGEKRHSLCRLAHSIATCAG